MTKRVDYQAGEQFGYWTIICRGEPSKRKQARWKCVCVCGKEGLVIGTKLRNGSSTCCGCVSDVKTRNRNWKGHGELSSVHWSTILRGAKERNINVLITIEDAWKAFLKQEQKCALTGLPLEMYIRVDGTRRKGTASLDRIDSTRDYTLDNIQWVHKHINKMKMEFSLEYFIDMCKLVSAKSVTS